MRPNVIILWLAGLGSARVQYSLAPSVANGSQPYDGFVSYSIEFSSFPDFAGNTSHPNTFSNQLLENIKDLIGTKPYIRVGGNTQDYAIYNASLSFAINGTFNPNRSLDYPTTLFIGPSFFESYTTWPGVKFAHGFNMGLGGNSTAGWQTLLDTVPLACKALGQGRLYWWEYGNEPDLFSTSSQGPVRPAVWNETAYVQQYLNGTRTIKELLQKSCPDLAGTSYGYLGPSFAGTKNHLRAPLAWEDGVDMDRAIKLFSSHNYISGAQSPGVTLQGTLMNHSNTARSVDAHVSEYSTIKANDSDVPPHIFGETNSLYNEGKPGLSNAFGAALWGVDFNLYSASVGFKRVHMHMGTNYRYASWQPIETDKGTIGTKAPYYGNIAVAAFLGNLTQTPVVVRQIPLPSEREAAYAAYTGAGETKTITRVLVLNLEAYNTTKDGAGLEPARDPPARGSKTYSFGKVLPGTAMNIQRLLANGSDAITGITWDGWSYNYELDNGRPVRLANVTIGETAHADGDGMVTVTVPDSSAAMLSFRDGGYRPHGDHTEGMRHEQKLRA
ncbi:hypothetical protein GQ53DRAFT_752896 [Thozetella sp. PMI_491]|nr:hypothetical protein GQ53DRAFT_752896 [Thozetella sp. PMI_491]